MLKALIIADAKTCAHIKDLFATHHSEAELYCVNEISRCLALMVKQKPALCFLDLDLYPGMLSRMCRALDTLQLSSYIIALSTHKDIAYEALEAGAAHFMLKPINRAHFARCIAHFMHYGPVNYAPVGDAFFSPHKLARVERMGVSEFVSLNDIVYIERAYGCTCLHSTQGILYSNKKLAELACALAPYHFFQVHKCYILNLAKAESFIDKGGALFVKCKDLNHVYLPVARRRRKDFEIQIGLVVK